MNVAKIAWWVGMGMLGWAGSAAEAAPTDSGWTGLTARASSGSGDLAPVRAIDGDFSTRWSSAFNDHEWIEVEFPDLTLLSGLTIFWETAFAETYAVQVSRDLKTWDTVIEVESGDGGPDHLFFAPVQAKAVRIECVQRGTGWGHSIWEIRFWRGDQAPRLSASSYQEGSEPGRAMDGQRSSAWRPDVSDEEPTLTLVLPEPFMLGGLALTWLDGFPTAYDMQVSMDGAHWETVARQRGGNGGEDYSYFPAIAAEQVRIVLRECAERAVPALASIELKDGAEQATPIRYYQAKAKNIRSDLFPMWLSRKQEYWTIVGWPGEPNESLFSETGIVEPKKGGFSVQPFLREGDTLYTWADVDIDLALADGMLPLPSATWVTERWSLAIDVVMSGPPEGRFTAVRYRFIPHAQHADDVHLALAVRPIQLTPGWQHGGFSPIKRARFDEASVFYVDEEPRLVSLTPPASVGVVALEQGDIGEYILAGALPDTRQADDPEGKVGAGLMYAFTAQPGATNEVVVAFPLDAGAVIPASFDFESVRAEARAFWSKRLAAPHIEIPEPALIEVLKSNLGYILINRDGPWFKPGPRNYNHAWMRDGVLTAVATLRCGITDMTREFIETYTRYIREDGWVPWMILETGHPVAFNADPNSGEGHEYDSQGQYPFIVRQYFDYTGDEKWVRKYYPHVLSALRYGAHLRQRRMTDEYRTDPAKTPYYGLLPHSNSHEGYYPAKHSYWDDFWLLRGLKDGIYLAERLGHDEDVAWLKKEEADFRKALYTSIRTVAERAGIDIIAGCVELADADPTSTTMAIMVADEWKNLPQPLASNTFEFYWNELSARMKPGGAKIYTPYEVRNADVFVRIGWRDRALAALRYFLNDAVRPRAWNHMAEVVHVHPRAPAYIGDMPHTWVGADYVNAVRSLFVYEDNDRLVVGAGIDAAWLDKGVVVENLPTQFGPVSYRMIRREGELDITIHSEASPPNGIFLAPPPLMPDIPIRLNGVIVVRGNGMIPYVARSEEAFTSAPSPDI